MNDRVELFFGNRPKFKKIEVVGEGFSIVSLSDDVRSKISECESYAKMLDLAADNGLAFNRKRISDDEDMKLDIPLFWEDEDFYTDDQPTIKEQVGIAICGISGLAVYIGSQASKEQPVETVDEDEVTQQLNAQNAVQ